VDGWLAGVLAAVAAPLVLTLLLLWGASVYRRRADQATDKRYSDRLPDVEYVSTDEPPEDRTSEGSRGGA